MERSTKPSTEHETDHLLSDIPPHLREKAKVVEYELLPAKSKARYLKTFTKFTEWQQGQGTTHLSENVILS